MNLCVLTRGISLPFDERNSRMIENKKKIVNELKFLNKVYKQEGFLISSVATQFNDSKSTEETIVSIMLVKLFYRPLAFMVY